MSHIILRNKTYYFNKRIGNKTLRVSLQTKKRSVAFNIVQLILEKIEDSKPDIDLLKLVVIQTINQVFKRATALLVPHIKLKSTVNSSIPDNPTIKQSPPVSPIKINSLTYEKALQLYISDKSSYLYMTEQRKPVSQQRVNEVLKLIDEFGVIYFGKERDIKTIDFKEFDTMLGVLAKYPKRKSLPYRNYSVEKCLELAKQDLIPPEHCLDKSLSRYKAIFNRFFAYLYEKSILDINPVTNSRFKRFTPLSSRSSFSNTELRTLRAYYDDKPLDDHSCAFYLQLFGGLRNRELLQLKPNDVKTDLDTGIKYILVNGTKTQNATRRVPINAYLIKRGVIDYLMINNGFNIAHSSLSIHFTKLLKKLNINSVNEAGSLLSFYSLRHNFMTMLAGCGGTDILINAIVGHTQNGTKKDYIDSMNIDIRSMDDVIQRIPDSI